MQPKQRPAKQKGSLAARRGGKQSCCGSKQAKPLCTNPDVFAALWTFGGNNDNSRGGNPKLRPAFLLFCASRRAVLGSWRRFLREALCRHSPYGSSLVVMPISSDVFGTLLSTAGTCSGCSACCCFLFKYFLQSSSAKTQQRRHVRLP